MTREERRHALLVAALSNPAVVSPWLKFPNTEALCAFTGVMRTGNDVRDMFRANVRLATMQVDMVVLELLDSVEGGETS